jgi:hypothetical protein
MVVPGGGRSPRGSTVVDVVPTTRGKSEAVDLQLNLDGLNQGDPRWCSPKMVMVAAICPFSTNDAKFFMLGTSRGGGGGTCTAMEESRGLTRDQGASLCRAW